MAGLSPLQQLVRIRAPIAFRLTLPSLVNEAILILKASSLVSVVGVDRTDAHGAGSRHQRLQADPALCCGGTALFPHQPRRSPTPAGWPSGAWHGGAREVRLRAHLESKLPEIFSPRSASRSFVWIVSLIGGCAARALSSRLRGATVRAGSTGRWRLCRSVSRHAVPDPAVPALFRRPLRRPLARRDPRRHPRALDLRRRPISARFSAPASRRCRAAMSRRPSASASPGRRSFAACCCRK